jgi:hypothetical protein
LSQRHRRIAASNRRRTIPTCERLKTIDAGSDNVVGCPEQQGGLRHRHVWRPDAEGSAHGQLLECSRVGGRISQPRRSAAGHPVDHGGGAAGHVLQVSQRDLFPGQGGVDMALGEFVEPVGWLQSRICEGFPEPQRGFPAARA